MFYNKRSLLFNMMPGSGRNFIMQLLFVPVSLHRISRLHPPFDGKGAFHGILRSWNFERCITRNEKFIKLVFPTVEIYAHTVQCTSDPKSFTVVLNFNSYSEHNIIIAHTALSLVFGSGVGVGWVMVQQARIRHLRQLSC